MTQPELQARLQVVRSHYLATPWIRPRADEAPLLRSWQRSRDAGLRETDRVQFELVSRSLRAELDERHHGLIACAQAEVDRLAAALQGTGCAVLLLSPRGHIVDRRVHEAAAPAALLASTRVGVNVAERCVGTTAPAIALADGEPYLVGREAHFCASVRPYFCVAAPIDNPQGERVGALDITAYDAIPSVDIFSLVVDAATAIENRLFVPREDRLLVCFHVRAELLKTPLAAMVEIDADGWVVGANRAAERALCMNRSAILASRGAELFDADLSRALSWPRSALTGVRQLVTRGGLQVHASLQGAGAAARTEVRGAAGTVTVGAPACAGWVVPEPAAASPIAPTPSQGALPRLREVEWQTIERAVAAMGGNVSAAARQLGISRHTIYRRRCGREG